MLDEDNREEISQNMKKMLALYSDSFERTLPFPRLDVDSIDVNPVRPDNICVYKRKVLTKNFKFKTYISLEDKPNVEQAMESVRNFGYFDYRGDKDNLLELAYMHMRHERTFNVDERGLTVDKQNLGTVYRATATSAKEAKFIFKGRESSLAKAAANPKEFGFGYQGEFGDAIEEESLEGEESEQDEGEESEQEGEGEAYTHSVVDSARGYDDNSGLLQDNRIQESSDNLSGSGEGDENEAEGSEEEDSKESEGDEEENEESSSVQRSSLSKDEEFEGGSPVGAILVKTADAAKGLIPIKKHSENAGLTFEEALEEEKQKTIPAEIGPFVLASKVLPDYDEDDDNVSLETQYPGKFLFCNQQNSGYYIDKKMYTKKGPKNPN